MKTRFIVLVGAAALSAVAFARPYGGGWRPGPAPMHYRHHHGGWGRGWGWGLGGFAAGYVTGSLWNRGCYSPYYAPTTYVAPTYVAPTYVAPTVVTPAYTAPAVQTVVSPAAYSAPVVYRSW